MCEGCTFASMKKIAAPLLRLVLVCFSVIGFTGCVKDVDLDQMEEITLQPKAVVDLVSFKLEADLIPNKDPGVPISVEKTVAFEVITDDLEQDVVGVELGFDYFNSLPRTFNVSLVFLDDRNRVKQSVEFDIPPGSDENPVSFHFTHSFEGKNLELLTESTEVKVTVVMQPGPGATEGQLELLSTAAYQFEF